MTGSKRTFKKIFLISRRKAASDEANWIEDGKAFHRHAAATGNWPT